MKLAVLLFLPLLAFHTRAPAYRCKPCGYACDGKVFGAPGACPDCHMPLVEAGSITHATVAPADVCAWIAAHPKALLLDVRTAGEYAGKADPGFGTLKGAVNIPVQELGARIGELAAYKNSEVLVYCSHSHRSPEASYALTQAGFTRVTNLGGGMSAVTDKSCCR